MLLTSNEYGSTQCLLYNCLILKFLCEAPVSTSTSHPKLLSSLDDLTAWRRRWQQPASTNRTPGPPTRQPRGRGQKAWSGEEAEPQGLSWAVRSRLALQPRVPTESRLPAFQWAESWGHKWEVREGKAEGEKGLVFSRYKEGLCHIFIYFVTFELHVLT